jgi:hypothetical protein
VLSVSPKTVKQGQSINASPSCQGGQVESISAPDVTFQGNTGWVGDRAAPGDRTVTLVCANGREKATATDTFRIEQKPGPGGPGLHPSLMVSPKEVRPGETISFSGGCPNGRQESLTAEDVDLHGISGRVNDNAREGEHRAVRVCVEGSQRESATDTFRVMGGGPGRPTTGPPRHEG